MDEFDPPGESDACEIAPAAALGDTVEAEARSGRIVDSVLQRSVWRQQVQYDRLDVRVGGKFPQYVPPGRHQLPAAGRELIPLYRVIDQVGVDVQYTRGAWISLPCGPP